MNTPIHAPSSSPSSSSSSYMLRPPSCLSHPSRNIKCPMLLPQAICTSQKKYWCFRAHVEASFNTNPLKNYTSVSCSTWWSEAQSLVSYKTHNKQLFTVGSLATSTVQDVSDTTLIGGDKIGVLLLNLGGPETLEDVQPFLFNLFADPAEELKKSLWEKNVPAKVYVGMRYWHPFTEEAIEQIKRDGITKLVILPLYPQFSISTSGSSLRLLESIFREDEYLVNMQHTVIPSWYKREGYIKAMANLIEKELKSFDCPEEVMIFFSAHGVPLAYVEEAGDPYKAEMEECVDLIMEELETRKITNACTLAYQSRVGPVEWLRPYTDETIVELGKKGVKSLLAVPISFVSEHIETLEEIDVEYKELALESGIEKWGRVPALGCEPTFISDLADAVIESLPYVGAMTASDLEAQQSLVPLGSVEELLAAYDSQRRELPPPVIVWEWGWTKSAETWNGRVAMLAVLLLLFFEFTADKGLLHQMGIWPLLR
ncbi:Ferrochelatase-2, chloroplastic [Glycine soja]